MNRVLGCDVSKYQDIASTPYKPELNQMKDAGIQFVIFRSSENLYLDPLANYYYDECILHKIPFMLYGFLDYWPGSADSVNQGKFLVDWLKSKGAKNVRTWLDFERPSANFPALPPRQNCLNMIQNWLNVVDNGLGTESGIYLNLSTIDYLYPIPEWLINRPFWLAWPPFVPAGVNPTEHTKNMNPPPTVFKNRKVWQFSWVGPGMAAGFESLGLDLDWFEGSLDELKIFSGFVQGEEPPIDEPPIVIIPDPIDTGKVIAPAGLRIRSTPKVDTYNYLYTLPYNSVVNIYSKENNWAKIKPDKEEYCSLDYLKLGSIPPEVVVLYTANVNAIWGLIVRNFPAPEGKKLRTLFWNTKVSVYETRNSWARISPDKAEWVSIIYLK